LPDSLQKFDFGEGRVRNGLPNFVQNTFNTITPEDNPNITCRENHTFSIYPNPAFDFIRIEILERCFTPKARLRIYNSPGQRINESRVDENTSNQINIQHLAFGIYFVALHGPGYRIVNKFMKK
jgi:hypothetical protein